MSDPRTDGPWLKYNNLLGPRQSPEEPIGELTMRGPIQVSRRGNVEHFQLFEDTDGVWWARPAERVKGVA